MLINARHGSERAHYPPVNSVKRSLCLEKVFQYSPLTPVLRGRLRQRGRLLAYSCQHLGCHARHNFVAAAASALHGLLHGGKRE